MTAEQYSRYDYKGIRRCAHKNDVCAKLGDIAKYQSLSTTEFAEKGVGEECSSDESDGVADEDQRHDGVRDVVM